MTSTEDRSLVDFNRLSVLSGRMSEYSYFICGLSHFNRCGICVRPGVFLLTAERPKPRKQATPSHSILLLTLGTLLFC